MTFCSGRMPAALMIAWASSARSAVVAPPTRPFSKSEVQRSSLPPTLKGAPALLGARFAQP